MKIWYEVKVKYLKIGEDGKQKKVTEVYLFDAVSFTEAEARAYEVLSDMIIGEFVIEAIKKSKLIEIFPYDIGEHWIKVECELLMIDESEGREKKTKVNYLTNADHVIGAIVNIESNVDKYTVPYEITGVNITPILDIFPHI